ncbi:MAG: ThiF family adenylyltransferase [Clostridia bacterium]
MVFLVGCGGLGGWVAEGLAREKIDFKIADADVFNASNFNRQLYCTNKTLHKSKVLVAKERCKSLGQNIEVFEQNITSDNISLLACAQIVVDCTDNIRTRLLIEDYCHQNNIILVHGAINGYEGQIAISYPNEEKILHSLYAKSEQKTPLETSAYATMLVGAMQVNQVVKLLNKPYLALKNEMLIVDTVTDEYAKYKI